MENDRKLRREFTTRVDCLKSKRKIFSAIDTVEIINSLFEDSVFGKQPLALTSEDSFYFQDLKNEVGFRLIKEADKNNVVEKIIKRSNSISRFFYSDREPTARGLLDSATLDI